MTPQGPGVDDEPPRRPWNRGLVAGAIVAGLVAVVTSVMLSQQAYQLEAGTVSALVLTLLVAFIVSSTVCIILVYVAARQRTRPGP